MNIFDKVFGTRKPNTIEISFGKDKFDVDFSDGSIEDGTITVGELRSQCTYITHTPAETIRLLYRGKHLTHDTTTLASVGMKSGSKILCMTSAAATPSTSKGTTTTTTTKTASSATTQGATVAPPTPEAQLATLLSGIQTDLGPQVESFTTRVPEGEKERRETHDRLAELLLQHLFAIDGVTCTEDAPQEEREAVRQRRKDAVRYTQGLLDRVDQVARRDALDADLAAVSVA